MIPTFASVFPRGARRFGGPTTMQGRQYYAMSDGHSMLLCPDGPPPADAPTDAADFASEVPPDTDDSGAAHTVARDVLLAWASPTTPACEECSDTGIVRYKCSCGHEHDHPCEHDSPAEEVVELFGVPFDARKLAPLLAALDGDVVRVRCKALAPALFVAGERIGVLMPLRKMENPRRVWPEASCST